MALRFLQGSTSRITTQKHLQVRQASTFRLPDQISNGWETTVTRLPSGLRVATQPSSSPLATIGVCIEAGSAYENEDTNGVSSILQNLAWKGTPTKDRQTLVQEAETLGVSLSSYTSRQQTGYFADTSIQAAPQALAMIADVVQNKNFSEENVERARQTALHQAKAFRHQLDDVLFDHVHALAYQKTGMAQPIVGEPRSIKRVKTADLNRFVSKYYTAPRTVVVGVGVPHEQFVKTVEQTVNLPNSNPLPQDGYLDWIGSELKIRDDTMHEVHSVIGFEAVPFTSPHYWAFLVIQGLVGNWDNNVGGTSSLSSRLAELSSLERLGHSFQSFYCPYRHTGMFGIYLCGNEANADDFVYAIFNAFQIWAQYMTADELHRGKAKAKISLLSQLQGNTAMAHDIGRSVLLAGRHVSVAEALTRIDQVEMSDVTEVLRTYFTDVDPAIAAQGPLEYWPDYAWSRSWTYWNRW